ISSVVNNEIATILYSSLVCLFVVNHFQLRRCSPAQAVAIGALVGGGLLVKQTTLFAAPIALWMIWTTGEPAARWKRLVLFTLGFLATGLWWPLHNVLSSGHWFPCYTRPENQAWAQAQIQQNPLILLAYLRTTLETSFLPDWSWHFLRREIQTVVSYSVAALLGMLALYRLRHRDDPRSRQLCAMSGIALLLLLAGILQYSVVNDWRAQMGGRYLLNGIPWAVTLVATSLPLLMRPRSTTWRFTSLISPAILTAFAIGVIVLFDVAWWVLVYVYYQTIAGRV
ncbi:MAG: hypothetical protein M3347_10155, partial [Armatimonadota bacterium]|nr:hypothetical protein [Armatimonadota bacterium]